MTFLIIHHPENGTTIRPLFIQLYQVLDQWTVQCDVGDSTSQPASQPHTDGEDSTSPTRPQTHQVRNIKLSKPCQVDNYISLFYVTWRLVYTCLVTTAAIKQVKEDISKSRIHKPPLILLQRSHIFLTYCALTNMYSISTAERWRWSKMYVGGGAGGTSIPLSGLSLSFFPSPISSLPHPLKLSSPPHLPYSHEPSLTPSPPSYPHHPSCPVSPLAHLSHYHLNTSLSPLPHSFLASLILTSALPPPSLRLSTLTTQPVCTLLTQVIMECIMNNIPQWLVVA